MQEFSKIASFKAEAMCCVCYYIRTQIVQHFIT